MLFVFMREIIRLMFTATLTLYLQWCGVFEVLLMVLRAGAVGSLYALALPSCLPGAGLLSLFFLIIFLF